MTFRQDAQTQQIRQMPCVGVVIAVLQTRVLRNRCRVRQVDANPCGHQSVHQPVPVVRGLHHHANQVLPVFLQCLHDHRQFVRIPPLVQEPSCFIHHVQHTIIRMQIDCCVYFHRRLLTMWCYHRVISTSTVPPQWGGG